MSRANRAWPVLVACLLSAADWGTTPARAADIGTIAERLKKIGEAYYPLAQSYPEQYTCEMRSPELVAAMDKPGQDAWGKGHVLVTKDEKGIALSAENLANPKAAPIFNVVIGLWQLRLAAELKILEVRTPGFVAACLLAAATRYDAFETPEGKLVRFGVRARAASEAVQEVELVVDDTHAIREMRILDNQGGEFKARIKNSRSKLTDNKWVATSIEAGIKKRNGKARVWTVTADYTVVGAAKCVVYKTLAFRVTDNNGKLVKDSPQDVNPVTFQFSNYRILQGTARTAREPSMDRLRGPD